MLPGDQLVCALVIPTEIGTRFSRWPLHVTIVPWFRTSLESSALIDGLQACLTDVQAFTVAIGEEAHFGYHGRKLVSLVRMPSELTVIEQRIRRFLKEQGSWIVDESTKQSHSFIPHITVQHSDRLVDGDYFICHELYLIEQQGNIKKVVGKMELTQ